MFTWGLLPANARWCPWRRFLGTAALAAARAQRARCRWAATAPRQAPLSRYFAAVRGCGLPPLPCPPAPVCWLAGQQQPGPGPRSPRPRPSGGHAAAARRAAAAASLSLSRLLPQPFATLPCDRRLWLRRAPMRYRREFQGLAFLPRTSPLAVLQSQAYIVTLTALAIAPAAACNLRSPTSGGRPMQLRA